MKGIYFRFLMIITIMMRFQQNILANDTVQNINSKGIENNILNYLGIIFGVIGIIGTIYTVKTWRDSKKDKEAFRFLIDVANKNIDKNITEKDIEQKKDEVKRYSQIIGDLQDQIKKDIPIQARVAVLKDKLNAQNDSLIETYSSIQKISAELKDIDYKKNIPKEILSLIENEINPEYIKKEKRSKSKTYLTLLTTLAAISSTIFPKFISLWITIPLFALAIPSLTILFKEYWPSDPVQRKMFLNKILATFFSFTSIIGLIFSSFFFYLYLDDFNSVDQAILNIIAILTFISFALALLFILKAKKDKKLEIQ